MPKFSQIANKVSTCVSIDREKLIEAKKRGLNISAFLDEALSREFNPDEEKHFNKAITHQNKTFRDYIEKTDQQNSFDQYKFGDPENVLEEREQENKSPAGSFTDI